MTAMLLTTATALQSAPCTRPLRRHRLMKPHLIVPALIAATGGFVTFVHD